MPPRSAQFWDMQSFGMELSIPLALCNHRNARLASRHCSHWAEGSEPPLKSLGAKPEKGRWKGAHHGNNRA